MASRSQVSPARRAAFAVLRRVFEDGAYADRALRSESAGLDERDRALARQLAYGSVQRIRTLDHAIEALGRRPVRKLDHPVRAALRLGCYQLAFLDGVPRYAAVNESVELVRAARLERAVSFTNAVLRRLADGARELCGSLPDGTALEAALRHSYPDWIAETWWHELGADEARALMRVQNAEPETSVRLVRGSVDGKEDPLIPAPGSSTASTRRPSRWAGSGRRAAGRSSSATRSGHGPASGRSISAPPRVARRRCSQARSSPSRWTRPGRTSSSRRRGSSARRASASSRRTAASCRASSPASTARSSTLRAPGSASSPRAPICAGGQSRSPISSSSSCALRSRACERAGRSSTPRARSTRWRTRRSWTRWSATGS